MSKKPRFFTVDKTNKYIIDVAEVKNLENVGDDFVTEEELREMLGLNDDTNHYTPFYNQLHYLTKAMKAAVLMWKGKLVGDVKSVICTDTDLLEAIEKSYTPVSDLCEGLLRRGNRFQLKPHKKTQVVKPTLAVFQLLINMAHDTINKDVKYHFWLKYTREDIAGSIELLKKLVTWKQIEQHVASLPKTYYCYNDLIKNMPLMKIVWDDPSELASKYNPKQ